jgi:hypothetical protein
LRQRTQHIELRGGALPCTCGKAKDQSQKHDYDLY